jgi:hypothetical protein
LALADQLVAAERAKTWSEVMPPGCACVSSVGTGTGAVSSPIVGAAAVAGATGGGDEGEGAGCAGA